MSAFNKAYKFVNSWLWDCREYGSERRTSGRAWDNDRCADVADMLKDYTQTLQAEATRWENACKNESKNCSMHQRVSVDIGKERDKLQAENKQLIEWNSIDEDKSNRLQSEVDALRNERDELWRYKEINEILKTIPEPKP